jgi:hypothetical protein
MREKTLKTQIEALLAQADVWALGERLDKNPLRHRRLLMPPAVM